jgi:U3 small nucleolar RNA-associated protein 18
MLVITIVLFLQNFTLSSDGKLMALAGRDGTVVLMTAHTREWIGSVKMSGKCHALSFSADGSQILTYGSKLINRINIIS